MLSCPYQIRHLTADRLNQALPLLQARLNNLDLSAWQRFAEPLVACGRKLPRGSQGIVAAERRGYIRGLFAYRCLPDLAEGNILLVQHVAVLELLHPVHACEALVHAMVELARDHGCGAIYLMLHDGDEAFLPAIRNHRDAEAQPSIYTTVPLTN